MRRLTTLAVTLVAAAALVAVAVAAPPGAVKGDFSQGLLASSDPLAKYISARDVWCAWKGNRVIVHLTVRNRSVERVEATIKPRYFIHNGGEHGSSFFGAKDFLINGGSSRSITIDAGSPKGTPARSRIGRCAPMLYLLSSG
jgi:hypothetical protein